MKKLTPVSMLMLGLMVAFAGCDAAKDAADKAKDSAKDASSGIADSARNLADIDLGNFDMKSLREKFSGITDGLKDVSADNVDGLKSKITDLTSSLDGMEIAKLPGPAKSAVHGAITKFMDSVKKAMDGISDEGILGKLKPAVDTLMEKLGNLTG